MAWTRDDFTRIRWAALAAVLMATIGGSVLYASHQIRVLTEQDHGNAIGQYREVISKLSRTLEEEREMKQLASRWDSLNHSGVVGAERRLEWVELIRDLRNRHRIPDIRYEIRPQTAADPTLLPPAAGRLEFRASRMQMTLLLRHEGQMLDFLRDLHASQRGYPLVRNCRMDRITGSSRTPEARLKAECSLDWITIRERDGKEASRS